MPPCEHCGAPLASDDPAGLCPKCLIQSAFDSSIGANDAPAEATYVVPPSEDDFGRYRIVRTLGEGGMGTVYLAEQREPIRRDVAIKVVKLGMDTSQVLVRFGNERQALAMMDHPNIARIFDAGSTSRGRPYFVMEYIDGLPITDYCDRHRLTISARLQLFLCVCRAVHHAHDKGIIHRDLKPSNVLVTEHDGAPVVKVIDFGIAKAVDQWAFEKTLLTEFGQLIGTPEYASPEQAEVLTGAVGATSDVYSLGALVYELLVGVAPFDPARLRQAGLSEMLRIIREEDAPAPSRRLDGLDATTAAAIAANRQTSPASLRRLVDGDLTWIAMRALEKERQRRYQSAADLAGDIQRHLDHRPVQASPPTRTYRTRKFIRRHRLAALGTAAALVLLGSGSVTAWLLARGESSRATLNDKDTIILADFENRTGDPIFDDTLRQGLSVALRQSPFLSMISDQQIQATLRLMGQSPDARVTAPIARQLCERTGSAAVLEGSIAALGTEYVVGLRARNCNSGDILDEEQIEARRREDVLNSLSQIAQKLRTRFGESLATVQKYSVPLEATTSSLEALKEYSTGMKVNLSSGNAASIPYYRRAVEIDSGFAMPYAVMGINYTQLGEWALARENTIKAWQLRDRVSDRERFFIDFTYDRQVTGNLEKAFQTLQLWAQTYRKRADPDPRDLLAGLSAKGTGRWDVVIEQGSNGIAARPDFALGYENLIDTYFFLDRFDQSESILRQAFARKLQSTSYLPFEYNLGLIKGDEAQMDRAVTMAKGRRVEEHWLANCQALALARSGRLQEAQRVSRLAVARAEGEGAQETAATYQAVRAVWEALLGEARQARKDAAEALAMSNSRDVQYAAALADGFGGDASRADSLASDLERRLPEDTFVRFTYVPVLRAVVALHRNQPSTSVEHLRITVPYELAINGLDVNLFAGGLHSAYVRGEALMAAHRYPEAANEFHKILEHRGIVGADPIGALAYLQIGRAFARSGASSKAKEAYATFLDLWKDADPDMPLLNAARAEYERLR